MPQHAEYVHGSPYTLRLDGAKPELFREDELVGMVGLPRRPKIYDMQTADGIPYWKIALLHLDSIAPRSRVSDYMRNEARFRVVERADPARFRRLVDQAYRAA